MTYLFDLKFSVLIKTGLKKQTIRKIKLFTPQAGTPISLKIDAQNKITDDKVIKSVNSIVILPNGEAYFFKHPLPHYVSKWILTHVEELETNCHQLKMSEKEKDFFAHRDGFVFSKDLSKKTGCFKKMFDWFNEKYSLPFAGHVITWQ